jgi:hypothetical protein
MFRCLIQLHPTRRGCSNKLGRISYLCERLRLDQEMHGQFVAPNPCFCLQSRQKVGGSKLSI